MPLVHVPPVFASVKFIVLPLQTSVGPVIAPGVWLTVSVMVWFVPQPLLNVIVAVPADTGITRPVDSICATEVLLLLHAPVRPPSDNVMVLPVHTAFGPDIGLGLELT